MMGALGIVILFPTMGCLMAGEYIYALGFGILSLICFIDKFAIKKRGKKND